MNSNMEKYIMYCTHRDVLIVYMCMNKFFYMHPYD